jgi:glucose uptake protein GlcU
MPNVFDGCTDACGWVAAVVAVLCYGSFGVPLKTNNVNVEVNFFVMQSYKTIVCFLTSWFVIFLGVDVQWSSWGIASGLFWVPGASCGVYAIRNAGLAIAVGTWSSIMVLTSFVFGIIIFEEKVKSLPQTCAAFLLLICGLIGMSKYSAHVPEKSADNAAIADQYHADKGIKAGVVAPIVGALRRTMCQVTGVPLASASASTTVKRTGSGDPEGPSTLLNNTFGMAPLEIEALVAVDEEDDIMGHGGNSGDGGSHAHAHHDVDTKKLINKDRLVFFGGRISLTRRELGVLGAVVNGAWGGMNLIPLHFALRDDGLTGAGYLISYATGALLVNTGMWLLLYLYYAYQKKGQWEEALEALPKFHLKELWKPGLMAGLLYSLGNFSAILAVTYLGHGTGFSFCQMQLFVSGLWGVFYFREVSTQWPSVISLCVLYAASFLTLRYARVYLSHTLVYICLFFNFSRFEER